MLLIEDNFGELFAVSHLVQTLGLVLLCDSGEGTGLTSHLFAAHLYRPSTLRKTHSPSVKILCSLDRSPIAPWPFRHDPAPLDLSLHFPR